MQRRNINHKEQRRNRGTLGGPNRNWSENQWGTLKNKAALAVAEEGAHPGDQVWWDAPGAKSGRADGGGDVIKTTLDIEKKRGNLDPRALP